jgi:type IV pilus assembly protein PilV
MRSPAPTQRGILLLESLIAILLISFGILGLVALWANSVKNTSEAKYRSDASFLANELIAQMWLSRPIAVGYTPPATWTARVAATLPGGIAPEVDVIDDPDVPGAGQVQATVKVNWQLPGHDSHSFVSIARINGAGPM